ncbi:uncharacterized protein VICG_01084 [Vittaforma corneae ATCC 50505]|uniref:Anaphase-promoting complex subunit 4 WD40 domain-containing protein n=1 Tax=Vittaforma corneae (strain ATCC 50505) TaxID=993615 RepID=L2GN20_VITCO|nr:uncharacterized protein VICG_01084 [Vittaforma corneae ATCC 50505]ELA41900.1 hypothetical protein VICG_01084 [Vittaforma corneae ATCC 50505]
MDTAEENFLQLYSESPASIQELDKISNLEYSTSGEIFSYTTDSSLKIYSATTNSLRNIISVKIDTMKYFQNNTVLHSKDNLILYLSIYDNRYMRKFEAHCDDICSISVNSNSDTFMSVGKERINLWDIRYQSPVFSLDSNGKLGALSKEYDYALSDSNFIYIFDWRNDKGPLAVKNIKPNFYQKLWYTGDGACICLSTYKNHTFLDSQGNFMSNFLLENSCDPDIINESNILISGSSNYIFSYKIPDKKVIGRASLQNFECSTVRTNPVHPQFICATEHQLKIWNMDAG